MANNKKGGLLLLLIGAIALFSFTKKNQGHIVIDPVEPNKDPNADFLVTVDDQAYFFNKPFDGTPVFINKGIGLYDGYKDEFFPGWVKIKMPTNGLKYYVQQGDYSIRKQR